VSSSIPTREPIRIMVGQTVKFRKYYADYDPASWTLKYHLATTDKKLTITGSDNGDGYHLIHATPNESSAFTPGLWFFQAVVTDGTDEHLVGEGRVDVIPSLEAAVQGYDSRSHVKRVLDALEAMLENKASDDMLSMSIATPTGNRSLSSLSPGEVVQWYKTYLAMYQRELRDERLAQGMGNPRIIKTRIWE